MYVITADQKKSRKTGEDAVPRALRILAHVRTVLPFERTVGDEIQGVVADANEALKAIKLLANLGQWHCGLGIGEAEIAGITSTTEGTGKAFINARKAVERAKKNPYGFALHTGKNSEIASSLQALIRTKCMLITQRTERQKQIIALREAAPSATAVAEETGVSKAAVSKVLKASNWELESGTDTLTIRLLEGLNR